MQKRLLVIGDSPTISTGFGVVVENIFTNLNAAEWDIHILGINYYGDPHKYQQKFKIYNPSNGGDVYGMGRIPELLHTVRPDLIFIINDPWVIVQFMRRIKQVNKDVPIVAYVPVDSPALRPEYIGPLNELNHVVSYTQWGLEEMRKSGLQNPQVSIIPHGINPALFSPMNKETARKDAFQGNAKLLEMNPFVVLYTARNQPRKRVDLYVHIIAEWMKKYPHDNVVFHYHGAPKADLGWDIEHLAWYYGIDNRLIITSKGMGPQSALPVEKMRVLYNAADVYLQVCAVEGWGLPLMEAMACGLPCIVPDYSALSEWPSDAVYHVPVDDTPWHNINDVNTLHKFINVSAAVEALEFMYMNKNHRDTLGAEAVKHVTQQKFMWKNIAKEFNTVFHMATQQQKIQGLQEWKNLSQKLKLVK